MKYQLAKINFIFTLLVSVFFSHNTLFADDLENPIQFAFCECKIGVTPDGPPSVNSSGLCTVKTCVAPAVTPTNPTGQCLLEGEEFDNGVFKEVSSNDCTIEQYWCASLGGIWIHEFESCYFPNIEED